MRTMKLSPFIYLALLFAPVACKDVGANPWDGWNQRHIGKASFAVPPDMQWVEVDGRPTGLAEMWASPDRDQSLRASIFYGARLDTSQSFPPSDHATDSHPIWLNGYQAQRLTFLSTSGVWEEITGIWIPDLRDNGTQMMFMVIQYGKPSPQTAAEILASLRIESASL